MNDGGNITGSGTLQTEGLDGATAKVLKTIMSDLEEIKADQAGSLAGGKGRRDRFKYLEDKTLYSSD